MEAIYAVGFLIGKIIFVIIFVLFIIYIIGERNQKNYEKKVSKKYDDEKKKSYNVMLPAAQENLAMAKKIY